MDQNLFLENFTHITNIIGVIAFAISGAMTGMRYQLDLLGLIVLGIITAVGGGITRDVLVNKIPNVLINPEDIYIAVATVIITFIVLRKVKFTHRTLHRELLIMDSIGLAIFTIIGAKVAMKANISTIAVAIFATITGVGGGAIRDVLVSETPIVLKEGVYASLCFVGAILYVLMPRIFYSDIVIFSLILVVRIIVIKYKFNLPH